LPDRVTVRFGLPWRDAIDGYDRHKSLLAFVADERKQRHAADAALEFMHRHPIATHWGRADLASSDMMSLETTRSVWQSRADPRRRTASIGMYTHVRDRWGIFYGQPILLNGSTNAKPALHSTALYGKAVPMMLRNWQSTPTALTSGWGAPGYWASIFAQGFHACAIDACRSRSIIADPRNCFQPPIAMSV